MAVVPPPASSTSPPPAAPKPAGQATVSGNILFKDAQGNIVPDAGKYAEGFTVRLMNGETLVASNYVKADGSYQIQAIVRKNMDCTLQLLPPAGNKMLVDTSGINITLNPESTTLQLADSYITDTTAPVAEIVFYTQQGQDSRLNPVTAAIQIADDTQTSCTWRLLDTNGTLLAQGESSELAIPFAALPQSANTLSFILETTATDAAGNMAASSQEFYLTPHFHAGQLAQ
ncbi:hypothetical protein LJC61_04380 [Ruminococcaceae bacterium OttesenSCG-928-A16]|nr:hypothetical protein [Ruminococcaceae bacterium OttesenSCG-928-A16]